MSLGRRGRAPDRGPADAAGPGRVHRRPGPHRDAARGVRAQPACGRGRGQHRRLRRPGPAGGDGRVHRRRPGRSGAAGRAGAAGVRADRCRCWPWAGSGTSASRWPWFSPRIRTSRRTPSSWSTWTGPRSRWWPAWTPPPPRRPLRCMTRRPATGLVDLTMFDDDRLEGIFAAAPAVVTATVRGEAGRAADGGPGLPGRVGRAGPAGRHARVHPGPAPGPVRGGAGVRRRGAPGQGDRPGRGRRVRAEVRGRPGGGDPGRDRDAAAPRGALGGGTGRRT